MKEKKDYLVVLDAGHGGIDPGAVYEERKEKEDALNLTLGVGEILEQNGIQVEYTRTADVFHTPFEKADMGNRAGADLFVSIHRDSTEEPGTGEGVSVLVYNNQGERGILAKNILEKMEQVGYKNRGIIDRPNLIVLRKTKMPAVIVEVGFINNEEDNRLFDEKFSETAQAIADGILQTLGVVPEEELIYTVQVGAFSVLDNAVKLEKTLKSLGFDTFIAINRTKTL